MIDLQLITKLYNVVITGVRGSVAFDRRMYRQPTGGDVILHVGLWDNCPARPS